MDADEDGDTILGYLDSGLGGDLLRISNDSEGVNLREPFINSSLTGFF